MSSAHFRSSLPPFLCIQLFLLTMDSPHCHPTKRHLSRHSGSPSQLISAIGVKRVKAEVLSDNEAFMATIPELECLRLSDDEDVYVPPAMANPYVSEAESQAEDDDGGSDESNRGLCTLVSHTKQAHTEPAKWDADAKHTYWNEKYGDMDVEEAIGMYFSLPGCCCKSNMVISATMSKKWCSTAYNHFEYPKLITDNHGNTFCHFVCKTYAFALDHYAV